MFESDDFDEVLSQFEFTEDVNNVNLTKENNEPDRSNKLRENVFTNRDVNTTVENHSNDTEIVKDPCTPKHTKRKIINSCFDHKRKRKFPGPAGLLTEGFEGNRDETICQMELLSQDVDFTQNNLRGDLFESPLWFRLSEDLNGWNLKNVDSIKNIKQQAITGSLRRRKAHTVIAFVEAVDRSVTDPLIIMRDTTGNIKGTLHRDAWSAFSKYIAAEYCAFILWKPTILTTGAAFKKHYLNITLSNILAIYSSTILNEEENKTLPNGYSVVYEDEYTVIKTHNSVQNIDTNSSLSSLPGNDSNDLLEGLDSIFSDDIF